MQSNGIDNGTVIGLTNPSTFVGAATGMLNNEQMISDVNTFIFTVKTDAAVANTRTFQLPLVSTGVYNFWVDWGDGRKDYVRTYNQVYTGETSNRVHTYRTVGTYTIKITGVCRGWSFYLSTNEPPKIQSIERWGCLELIDDAINGQQFANCARLDLSNVKDTPRLTYITNFQQTFQYCTDLKIGLINNWDVSNVVYMSAVFNDCRVFNDFIGNWDVSNVSYMGFMFSEASAFDQPLGSWDVSQVTDMRGMFQTATSFNQPLGSWDVSKVTQMPQMFYQASAFDQPLGSWDVSKVTTMSSMFRNASAFNQDISKWNVSKVTLFTSMFNTATAFTNGNNSDTNPITGLQGINGWNINTLSNVSMANMFFSNNIFDQPIGSWNVSRVTDMSNMFGGTNAFNQDIGSWNIGAVTNIASFMSSKTPATFSAANLDAIYSGWSSRPSQSNLSITFGTANYTIAGGSAGRAILVSRGWTIVDGGGI